MVHKIYISTNDENEYLAATQRALFSINEIALSAVNTEDIPVLGDKRQVIAKTMIRESEVFLGLYDGNYGEVPEGETQSHIEMEYQFADELGKSMLIFVMDGMAQNASERQQAFLKHVMQHNVVTSFTDAEDLAAKVKVAIDNYGKTKRHRSIRPPMPTFREELPSLPGQSQTGETQLSDDELNTRIERAIVLAGDDLEQIVRRALELHEAQRKVIATPSEDFDNKITVEPIWGEPIRRSQFQSDIFMIMPFREKFNAVYEGVVRPVSAELNLTIKRGDDFASTRGSIIHEVWAALNACKLVIVETTEVNANVYYELGIAHTLGKPAILLTQTHDLQQLPFDIRHLRFLVYEDTPEGLAELQKRLRTSIIWLLNDLKEQAPIIKQSDK